ncbi:hypothetical protein ACTJKO_02615 [Curtobacterium sp. 22159]|uniref:hypothetical protein n=1 Tax=Curtobacterium sp. 22159 TaxID=3453882 RepID=UPI003F84FF35
MTPFTARCCLVGTAIVLLGAGIGAPLADVARAVVIGAAGACAVLDRLLVRAVRTPHPAGDEAADDEAADAEAAVGPADVRVVPGRTSRSDDSPPTAARTQADAHDVRVAPVVLGTAQDGSVLTLHGGTPEHVVVAGGGVLALAVFRAVAAQVRAAAVASRATVRIAAAPDLRPALTSGDEPCPVLPDGTAALVTDPVRGDCRTSIVFVSDPGRWPRRWDVAVEVTRYGCTVRRSGEDRGRPVSPVLPRLMA